MTSVTTGRRPDGVHRLIDEAPLRAPPAVRVVVTDIGVELADLELLPALLALAQLGLGGAPVTTLRHRALVLGAEALTQAVRPPLAAA